MFGPTADPGHKAMRLVFTATGNVRDGSDREDEACSGRRAGVIRD